MVFTCLKRLCCFVLILMMVACSVLKQDPAKLGELSRDDFVAAMRWKQYKVAASLIQPEHRQAFMKTFTAQRDVDIVDVRLMDVRTVEGNQDFETTIEIDYYLLPSVTVKTFSFDQTWVYVEGEGQTQQGFFISTPFPEFP